MEEYDNLLVEFQEKTEAPHTLYREPYTSHPIPGTLPEPGTVPGSDSAGTSPRYLITS